jgi:hypothetical protein
MDAPLGAALPIHAVLTAHFLQNSPTCGVLTVSTEPVVKVVVLRAYRVSS